jgi:hypothetical protein
LWGRGEELKQYAVIYLTVTIKNRYILFIVTYSGNERRNSIYGPIVFVTFAVLM